MPVLWTTWTNLNSKAKLIWSRLTLSWITIIYFTVAIVHCFVQVGLQSNAFAINALAANGLSSLLSMAYDGNETEGFAVLSGGTLKICYQVPNTIDTSTCPVIWKMGGSSDMSSGIDMNYMTGQQPNVGTSTTVLASVTSDSTPSRTISRASKPTQLTSHANTTFMISSSPEVTGNTSSSGTPSPTVTIIIIQPSQNVNDEDENGDGESGAATSTVSQLNNTNQDIDPLEQIVQELQRPSRREIEATPISEPSGDIIGVSVTGIPGSDKVIQLSSSCVKTLIYPAQTLDNTKREDITLIGFQVWVLGLSLVALLNESIPHLFASMVTQFLVAIWTIVQIFQTEHFRRQLITFSADSACNPSDILGPYWHNREMAEIASATLNGIVFVLNAFLHYNLMKLFGWQTFKRLGASLTINRIYKLVLIQSIAIQMALFFMVSTAALWIDQLYNGAVGHLATLGKVYKAGAIIMFVLLIPWLALGWFTIRREMRKAFLIFLLLNMVFVGLWAGIFDSTSFRWTFVLWPFFAVMVCVSGTLMLTTLVLGIICRLNFGKGLTRYLGVLEPLNEGEYPDMEINSPEKVDFPDLSRSSSVSSGADRFQPPTILVTDGTDNKLASTRTLSISSELSKLDLTRTLSQSSDASGTTNGAGSRTDKSRRWVIE
ncbi:hypothetical protein Clacol_003787 [Clathrus columnatus]|uniref:Uncharacterized protein n=1 Tax=Clathrus columnatus TaxID=1419009 RepID=A0AAV5AA08_9AGAM|nr:hypothetical protein Clacol_003787 [Clathrus columnatus]